MLDESVHMLNLKQGMKIADCTAGGGGHAGAFLREILPSGYLLAIDQDHEAVTVARAALTEVWEQVGRQGASLDGGQGEEPFSLVNDNFAHFKGIMERIGLASVDGAFMDLGVSSHQLDEGYRGFSYRQQGNLDMRMDPQGAGPTAYDVVMSYSQSELEGILWRYGQERWSRRIAQFIVQERKKAPIQTTDQLVSVIKKAVPTAARKDGPHPARRSFQALRIHVNHELEILEKAIDDIAEMLAPCGRVVIISYHSLEDKIVKDTFKKLSTGCTCASKGFPVCVCGNKAIGRVLTPKPLSPVAAEIDANPRSRSAKLRAFEKYSTE